MRWILVLGIGLIFLGLILVLISSMKTAAEEKEWKTTMAVGGLIGPIPFGFGNDQGWVKFTVILAAVIFVFWIVVNLIWFS
jgi:uncharacterized membrane protein